ncbi:hypothetical protein TRAPUB_14207 [Trametes pubescens]|uniref:Uncharacterized protein n=1 Tax=Trametes pubescens TaxID=154538 RepID=A0A1M2VP02_TRAPU|nr:hypothetical protein TRAPUB_14207 [Trametes pubescens]
MPPDPTTAINNAAAASDTANVFAAFQAMAALGFSPEDMARFFNASAKMSAPSSPQAPLNVPSGLPRSLNDNFLGALQPQSPHAPVEVPALRRSDYPQVQWWYKSDWVRHKKTAVPDFSKSNARGGTRAANSVNVRYQFMENTKGAVVSGYRASDARARFREFAIHLYKLGHAPDTWVRGIGSQDRVDYDAWMCKMCPELQLCHNSWKARELAVMEYPQWKPAYDKPPNEDVYNDEDEDDPQAAEDERNAVNVDLFLNNVPYVVEPSTPSLKCPFDSVDVVAGANTHPGSSKRPRVSSLSCGAVTGANDSDDQTHSEMTTTNMTTTKTTATKTIITETPTATETATTDMTATDTTTTETTATKMTATDTTATDTTATETPTVTATEMTATEPTATETAATEPTSGDVITNTTGRPALKNMVSTPSDSTSTTTVVTPAAAPASQRAHVVDREIPDLFDILPWSRSTSAQKEGNTGPSTTGPSPKTQAAALPRKDTSKTALPKTTKKKALALLEVWPPVNGSELKYVTQISNGTNTQLDFTTWYEKASYYFKKKLADKDPAASSTKSAPTASGSGTGSKAGTTVPAE